MGAPQRSRIGVLAWHRDPSSLRLGAAARTGGAAARPRSPAMLCRESAGRAKSVTFGRASPSPVYTGTWVSVTVSPAPRGGRMTAQKRRPLGSPSLGRSVRLSASARAAPRGCWDCYDRPDPAADAAGRGRRARLASAGAWRGSVDSWRTWQRSPVVARVTHADDECKCHMSKMCDTEPAPGSSRPRRGRAARVDASEPRTRQRGLCPETESC